MRVLFAIAMLFVFSFIDTTAAGFKLPENYFNMKPGDCKKYEKDIINAVEYLFKADPNKTEDIKKVNQFLLVWCAQSDDVFISLFSGISEAMDGNAQCMIVFMAGCAKYAIENKYPKDTVKVHAAGVKALIDVYQKATWIKKNDKLDEIVEIEKQGKLEQWVKEKLAEKK